MPVTQQQSEFLTTFLSVAPKTGDSAASEPTKTDLNTAQAAWRATLKQSLGPAVTLAKALRADPDPLGAEISAFVAGCIKHLQTPITTASEAEALETYLTSHDDIDILEADNPYGAITVRAPLLAALGPLRRALATA